MIYSFSKTEIELLHFAHGALAAEFNFHDRQASNFIWQGIQLKFSARQNLTKDETNFVIDLVTQIMKRGIVANNIHLPSVRRIFDRLMGQLTGPPPWLT